MHWVLIAEGLTTNLFLVGLALTVVMLLYRSNLKNMRRGQSAARDSTPVRPEASRARGPQAAEQETWQVEMHELSRDLTGRLDTKIALLEGLIRDARHEAARLEALVAQAQQTSECKPQAPRRRGEGLPAGHQAQALAAALRAEAVGVPPSGGNQPALGVALSDEQRRPAEAGTPTNRRFDNIYALADAGCDPPTIAQQLGAPVGEVELILSLRGKG